MPRPANELMARRVANELLQSLGIATYPVDPEAIAAQLRIPVVEVSGFPSQCFGALSLADGQFRILVSNACPTTGLRRFTISHEIGHASIDDHTAAMQWVTQEGGTQIAVSEGHYRSMRNPVEVEANHFASELLMPQAWAQPIVDALPVGLAAIRTLADRFNTSLTSAAVRYAALSADPVLVVVSHGTDIEWVTASREVAEADFFRYNATRTAAIPKGSATWHLAQHPNDVLYCKETSSSGYLREWMARAPAEVTVDIDAVGLGSYGRILTLLICSDFPEPDELYLAEVQGEESVTEDGGDWRTAMRREAGYGE